MAHYFSHYCTSNGRPKHDNSSLPSHPLESRVAALAASHMTTAAFAAPQQKCGRMRSLLLLLSLRGGLRLRLGLGLRVLRGFGLGCHIGGLGLGQHRLRVIVEALIRLEESLLRLGHHLGLGPLLFFSETADCTMLAMSSILTAPTHSLESSMAATSLG